MPLTYHRTFSTGLTGKYAAVLRRLPAGCRVLEVGCHTGYFSKVLMDRGYDVVAIEKDPEAARVAASVGVPVVCADVEDQETLRCLRGPFDRVIFMDVLEHLVDPTAVLGNVREILETDGRIVVTGPNVAYWAVRKDLLLGRWTYVDAGILDRTHLHFYTISGWRSLIEAAGYTVIAVEAAEGMLPLQHVLLNVPGLARVMPNLCEAIIRTCPSLFAIVILIEAVLERAH
jgi:SAM-dependent methyltransferase